MIDSKDRRSDKRMDCKIPIVVSTFISKHSMDALLVDHCTDGVSFISNDAFLQGTAIFIRVAYSTLKNFCNSDLEKLPSISIGEVKWCEMLPAEAATAYKVGLKYFPQVY